ncbi:MAG: hypothetical protein RMJ17_02880 [Candidatus Aenigmarchaeota archaeon]|nr:hypothetical protein [Candidatus Aenigmarchaeota archaeon]MDW8149511.1 hypothetical protein [Candidatus Aenigmarchaeota archaeon]
MEINIRKVLTSSSMETVEFCINSIYSSAPVGTSRSKKEAEFLSFEKCRKLFLKIKDDLKRLKFSDVYEIDEYLKKKIGKNNLSLAISMTFSKYFAKKENVELYEYISLISKQKIKKPKFLANFVGGLKHGGSNFQEFLAISDDIFYLAKKFIEVGKMIKKKDYLFDYQKNLESAWFCYLDYGEILDIMKKLNIRIGIDFAASSALKKNFYDFNGLIIKLDEQLEFVSNLIKNYNLKYVEDPFHENDFENFKKLTKKFGGKVIICGDDLYSTNKEILIKRTVTNAVIVKPSQSGLVSEAIEFIKEARKRNLKVVVSHRSNETDDTFITHFAFGCGADYVKFGMAGERIVKLNEAQRIAL